MSVVATASLILFERKVSGLIRFVPSIFREGLSTSLAAQIGIAPILFVTFGQFNIFSALINGIVLWTILPMTILGEIAGIASIFSFLLGEAILYLAYPFTYWFVFVVEALG